jgi:NAD-specific glutamate dehydrogenase/predicted ATPase/class 3 adenylate cyclase
VQTLDSRYEVLDTVSRRGNVSLLRARDRRHGRLVALKLYEQIGDETHEDILAEARALLSVQPHPGLPTMREDLDLEEDNRYVIVMDWIEGTDLGRLLDEHGEPGLELSKVLDYVTLAGAALDHLHQHDPSLVHGDVKPANLVLTAAGNVVLVDFGIATITGVRRRAGTPGYLAPEVAAGEPLTPAADVYGLAATTVKLLTGHAPMEGPPAWEGIDPAEVGALARTLRRGLASDPARRPAFAGQLAARLRADHHALPSGVVTFVATELVESASLWDANGDVMTTVCDRIDDAVAEVVDAHGGHLLKPMADGDTTFSAFAEASAAALAARDLHTRLAGEQWPRAMDIRMRAALHSGEAGLRDGVYTGPAVNRVVRLRALAPAGGVIVSQSTADLLAPGLPPDLRLAPLRVETVTDPSLAEGLFALVDSGESGAPQIRSAPVRPRGGAVPEWQAVVTADHDYWNSVAADDAEFPDHYPPRRFTLTKREVWIGRQNVPRGIRPEIDLSGSPEDRAVSHAHACLIRQADGSYALVDVGSKNGTTINDDQSPIANNIPIRLENDDHIHLGAWTTITVRKISPPEAGGRARTTPEAAEPRIPSVQRTSNNLPVPLTRFIGRRREVERLTKLVAGNRVCTVTGTAGVGKTRLALQVAEEVLTSFPDGVWVADLANVEKGEFVAAAVGAAAGIREGGSGTYAAPDRREARSATERLIDHLEDRTALLVLDNCEHVLSAATKLVDALVRDCASVHVLATSRESLGLDGEATYRLMPLGLPAAGASGTELRQSSSVLLFIDRATLRQPDLALDDDALEVVGSICRQLDGLPLAIELAAAQVKTLALPQITTMLERLDRFVDASRPGQPRQSTLRSMIGWSHKLLTGRERTLLRRLSVFAGDFSLDAAQQICACNDVADSDVLALLTALVEKSLVETDADPDVRRYRLLRATRQYAEDRLVKAGEAEELHQRHRAWYLSLAERAEGELMGTDQKRWLDELAADHENLRAAFESAATTSEYDDLRLAAALGHFWLVRGRLSEGGSWLDEALARRVSAHDDLCAKALCARGKLACFAGDLDRATEVATEALAVARRLANQKWQARAEAVLGLVAAGRGRLDEAEQLASDSVATGRALSDPWFTAYALNNLGNVLLLRGSTQGAKQCYQEALSIRRELDDAWGMTWSLFRLGVLEGWQNHTADAVGLLDEALARSRVLGFGQGTLLAVLGLAEVQHLSGDQAAAREHFLTALDMARGLEESTGVCLALAGLANVALANGDDSSASRWLSENETIQANRTPASLAALLRSRAMLAAARGDLDSAEAWHREALQVRDQLGDRRAVVEQLEELALTARRRGDLSRAAELLAVATVAREHIALPIPRLYQQALDEAMTASAESTDPAVLAASEAGTRLPLEEAVRLVENGEPLGTGARRSAQAIAERQPRRADGGRRDTTDVWVDDLREALIDDWGEDGGSALFRRYDSAFPPTYRADRAATVAAADIRRIEERDGDLVVHLHHPPESPEGFLDLDLIHVGEPIAVHELLPVLENLGVWVLDERPYEIRPDGSAPVRIYAFGLTCAQVTEGTGDSRTLGLVEDAFAQVWRRAAENDGFNRLVLRAGLPWRDVTLIRAYAKYLRQLGNAFNQSHMEQALAAHPDIPRLLIDLFYARFDPSSGAQPSSDSTQALTTKMLTAIDEVPSLEEDRILRRFLEAVLATVRTDFFQSANGRPKDRVSLKLDPSKISDVPLPLPMFEIFVCSPRVEGVHLRGGRVARGGIRCSDRRDDFRTEILGLMKAQTVKNTVIVPVGAKGGFVVKRPPPDPAALADETVDCYRDFIRGLLDVTDNLVDGRIVPPSDLIRWDDDDPYLVVAADKGTATFSDIANEISASHGFWLGDAFASGGSSGYDHKRMAITARGAWESVKCHFDELGVDLSRGITVVGIGDMSGDVFGNGMLRSRRLKVVASFDHRHVFLDPDPDPETTYRERERLFDLPRSTWDDFDRAVLSSGGGVFPRSAKSIPLSREAQQSLGIEADALTPDEVIRAILRAPVDLLWNGAIGTFVKASGETHADAGDRVNDPIRIDANELRCRVVGEGGNLGLTQSARVEFARTGGRINTDAIDNSGGVDCSDHEVNIKILLNQAAADGELGLPERDSLLANMTDEVAALVLTDNEQQARALARNAIWAPGLAAVHLRYMQFLEDTQKLNRELERLPSEDVFNERRAAGEGLTTPELAVLLAYTKLMVYDELLQSDVPEEPHLQEELAGYFPTAVREQFGDRLESHPLRREIIANALTNELVNRQELSFVFQVLDHTGASIADIVRSYAVAREVLAMQGFWADVAELEGHVPASLLTEVFAIEMERVGWIMRWLLRRPRTPVDVGGDIDRYRDGVSVLLEGPSELLPRSERDAYESRCAALIDQGVPESLARRTASAEPFLSLLDVVDLASEASKPVDEVATVYLGVGDLLALDWLRDRIAALPFATQWEMLARVALREDLYSAYRQVTASVLRTAASAVDLRTSVTTWVGENRQTATRVQQLTSEIRDSGAIDAATLAVALREIRNFVSATADITEGVPLR